MMADTYDIPFSFDRAVSTTHEFAYHVEAVIAEFCGENKLELVEVLGIYKRRDVQSYVVQVAAHPKQTSERHWYYDGDA